MSSSIVRSVYLACLGLTFTVALGSFMAGAPFSVMMVRTMLTLLVSSLLGWAAIMVVASSPGTPESDGRDAVPSREPSSVATEASQSRDDAGSEAG